MTAFNNSEQMLTRVFCIQTCLWRLGQIPQTLQSSYESTIVSILFRAQINKDKSYAILEYALRVKSVVDSLFAIGNPVIEKTQMYAILECLLDEYSPFMMQIYVKLDSHTLYDMKYFYMYMKQNLISF